MVQKQIFQMEKSFKKELFETLLALDLPEFTSKTGSKKFTTFQKLAIVILYFRSKLSLREFCAQINKESLWKRDLKLNIDLKKSTVNDGVREFDLALIKKILDQTNLGDDPKILGIDSMFKSSYYKKRLKEFRIKSKSPYHKLDIISNLENKKKILDFTFTMKQYSDKKQAKRLIKRFSLKILY